jgi:hypothetical protein
MSGRESCNISFPESDRYDWSTQRRLAWLIFFLSIVFLIVGTGALTINDLLLDLIAVSVHSSII